MWQPLSASSTTPLSSCLPMPALSSCLPMPALSSLSIPTLSCLFISASSFLSIPASSSRSMLSLALTHLTSLAFRTFKQALSDEPLRRNLISPSPTESLCPFPTLGPLSEKNNCK